MPTHLSRVAQKQYLGILGYLLDLTLELSHNKIKDSGARGLAKILSQPETGLKILKVSNNQIGAEGIKSIGKALQKNNKLEHLDLRLNCLFDEGVQILFPLLQGNCHLQWLDVSGNRIGPKSVPSISALLKHNGSALTKIDLSCNKLGDYVAERSNEQEEVKQVDVVGKVLFEAVSQNKVTLRLTQYLTTFDLRMTALTPEYLVAIQGIINENGTN